MEVMEILKPIIYAILAAVAGVLGFYIKKLGTQLVEWIKSKVGEANYTRALEVAQGLYIYLEDKYKDSLEKMGEVKRAEMEEMLLEKFPNLTQVELDSINKTIWASFQEGFNGVYPYTVEPPTERVDG